MAIKVNASRLYGNKMKSSLRVNASRSTEKNNGSAVGYLGARLGYGLAGLFEGFGDFVTGSIYQLAGDKEYAKYVYQNDIVGGWERALDRSYNPGKGMRVAGDIASGVGQALPSVAIGIATGGTSTAAQVIGGLAMGTAYAGQGVTRAVQTTGELGFKENAYGILSGAAEGATEMLLGGTVKAGKNLWTVAKGGTKSAAGKIARNGLLKNMWSSASSEFAEEFLQEYIDMGLLRLTGVDKNATTSLGNALYSGAIGFATGGLLGGATGSINAVNNIRRGESVRQRGLESQLLGTANYIRNDYLGKNANFDKISSEALRTLSAAVDAYNKLENKNTTRGAMLLGEIQAGTYAFEVATGVAAYRQQIMANPTEGHAAYVSELLGKTVTVEDLRQNKDGVAETLAVTSFATGAFTESHVDRVANAVHDRVEQGRYMHAREGARWDGTLSEDGEMVFRAPDGRYMIVTSDAMEGGEGKYRVGFSETREYDGEHIKVAGRSVTLADIKQGLAGLADGSLVIGENRLEPAQTRENAPASGEGVVNGQVMAEGANEAQRAENGGVNADSGEKVAENIEAVDGSRRSALPRTRARGDKTKTQAKAEKKAAERIAEEMRGENGRGAEDVAPYEGNAERAMPSRGYTDAEANTARGLVKDFDLMPPSVRRSVVEMIRSGEKSGASKNFLRHSANLIAYWRQGLWIIADDKTRDDGFYTTFTDGSRLIVVKPNREAKAVSDTLMHELAHDVWARADAATRQVLYELATAGVKQEEIDAIRERYREELTKRGEIPEKAGERSKVATTESESNGLSPHPSPAGATFPAGEGKEMTEAEVDELLDEEVATNLIGEIIGKEEFLGRFDGSETSTIKRILRTLSNMKKRFTGKDKYLYRKADDLFKAFTKVMALEEVGAMAAGERKRNALSSKQSGYTEYDKPITLNDVEVLRSIGKKSINQFTQDEIKTAQKWAYKFYKELGVKSPFFRAWFGEWRAHDTSHIDFVSIKSDRRKEVINADTGWKIQASRKVHKETSHQSGSSETNATKYLPYIDDITQKAVLFDSVISSKDNPNSLMFHTMYAYTEIMGYPALLKLQVEELFYYNTEGSGEINRDYILQSIEEESLSKRNRLSRSNHSNKDPYTISISDLYSLVKEFDKNFIVAPEVSGEMLNDDGTPKVFYHGTDADFNAFSYGTIGNASGVEILGEGFYFTDKEELAKKYGKNVKACYLRMSNPYIATESDLYNLNVEQLSAQNYDGVIMKSPNGTVYMVFENTQVKSATDNIGTFDGQDPNIRHAIPKPSGDEMIRQAVARGYGDKAGANSQTSEKTEEKKPTKKPKKTAAQVARENAERKAAAEMAQVEEKAARTVRRAQKSAENAVKNAETLAAQKIARTEEQAARRVRNAEKSAENAKKNADKKFAAEQARRDRESSETIKRSSREIARIDKNLDYLKNAVLHRSGTDGGTASAIIFEDPALRAVVKRLASRGTAYGLLHKSTREGMQDLLAWYTPENEILKGNAVDELLAASPQSVSNVFGAYNADIREKIERIANGEGDITAAELADLDIVVNAVARLYLTYGKVKWQGKRVSVEGLAFDDYREQMETRRALISGKEADGKPTVILKKIWNVIREGYLYSVVTPEVVLRDLENNRKGGVLSTLYRNIRLGEAEAGRIRAEILTPVATFFSEHKAYRRTLSTDRRIEFRGHQITAAQAVGLWETSKREQAQQRMFDEEKGGIRIAIYDEAEGRTVTRHVKVTSTDLDNLYNQFTEEDRGYIKALEESFKIASRYKVETDGEVWGYTNAIKGHYYPITTDENYFARDITDVRDLMSTVQVMNNKSFNKNTVQGAQAWLFIEDSLRVLERHAQGISAYSGLYIPLQTFGLVYGAKFDPTGTAQAMREEGKDGGRVLAESVVQKTSLREYYNATLWNKEGATGTNLDKYLSKLFSDIQGITGERDMVDKVIAKIQSGYITATFGLNAKIILTQLASYGAAYKNLDADVLVQALARENSREAWREQGELMDKYSRITLARSFEGTGAAEGLVDQIGEVGRLATKGIDFTDRAVIVKLFMACQLQAEKNGVGEVGSEANLKEAGEMLDALLLDTQTTSLKSDASALMRSKNMVAKMVTMFRTESMKSFSNLYTSIGAYVNHKQFASAGLEGYSEMLEEDKKRIAKTSTSFLLSATWVAAVSVLFSRIRKAAKGEEEEEKLLAQGMREIGGNVIELFPVVSEIASYMLDGYELESIPVSVINQGLSTLKNTKVLFDAEASDAERARFLREAINTVGSFAGLPTRNAGRIALAATTIVSKRRAYEVNDAVKTNPTYQSDFDRALANGNDRLAETVLSAWFDRKKGGSPREAVSNEILRLYKLTDADGKSLLSLPKNVPASLNRKQSAAFSAVYAEADGQIAVLIASKAYGALDDAAKAKAIKAAYDMAWSRAAESLGLEDTGSAIKMVQASVDPSIMAAVAGFAKAYVGDGRKEKVIAYLKSLGLSKKEYNKYLAALGYKTV